MVFEATERPDVAPGETVCLGDEDETAVFGTRRLRSGACDIS